MCPACMAAAVQTVAAAVSTGGLATLLAHVVRSHTGGPHPNVASQLLEVNMENPQIVSR